ncbi:MAG: transcriptional repressor [Anaerolineae bacterium]|nr:transcriptional repressor [Anaerolineae bacterium]MDW8069897.1 Fur family transcriptional regulator [Anaerolineae bacterium]
MSCEQGLFKSLRRRGLRLTAQRRQILSALHEIGQLATAEEIFRCVRKDAPSMDISTVYRTLELLREFRVVTCVQGNDGHHRYELAHHSAPHVHMVCRACGKVFEVGLESLQPFIACARERYGFEVDVHALSVEGLCHACCARPRVETIISHRK